MVAACRNRKTRAQLLRRRRAQLRRRRAQLRRRRAQLLRRRRKHTIRRKIRHRKLLPKRRKQPLKRGRLGKKTVSKKAEPKRQALRHPSDEFVVKVLRRLHRDKVAISTKAKGKIISFIRRFYNNVSDKAKSSSRCKKSCTIGSRELENALKRVMRKKQATELVKTIRSVSRRH